VNTKQKQDTYVMRLVNDRCDNRTMSIASVLVCRILFRSFIVACMLLELFQTTTVNTKQKKDTYVMRLVNDRCDNWTRSVQQSVQQSDAWMLVWIILFRSFIVACMLLEFVQSTTVNTKHRLPHPLYGSFSE
jgi:anaerobic C4-dicarboxylate transporter